MPRTDSTYVCSDCGADHMRWAGKCMRCGQFGTVQETSRQSRTNGTGNRRARPPIAARSVTDINAETPSARTNSGISEFDRVLGGGFAPGQVVLLSGEPGAGKSTLLLQVANSLVQTTGKQVLYLSGEESAEQIAIRAARVGAQSDGLLVADETDVSIAHQHIQDSAAELALVIVDSVQTMTSPDIDGRAGGVAQVMAVTQLLTRVAKDLSLPMCLVGQVTKESTVAGPRALEHICDATLTLEGDTHSSLRLLRSVKNRFGPADEVACFEQTEAGIREVVDPSTLFRADRDSPVPGTCLTVAIQGRRPMLVELQSLISPTTNPNPRRGVSGLESARVAMIIAVTERAASLRLFDKDVFVATVGGIRLSDPACDLAVALAIASAGSDRTVPLDTAAIGEVTLSGDIRNVSMANQRIAELARLGYRRILAPPGVERAAERDPKVTIVEVRTLSLAIATA